MKNFISLVFLLFAFCGVNTCGMKEVNNPFTIDIYLPIFSCLDEFVAGNLFSQKENNEYGKIWVDKEYTQKKEYVTSVQNENINNTEDLNFYVTICGGLNNGVSGGSSYYVYLPIYNFKKGKYLLRFFFADTNDFYSAKDIWWANKYFAFHGNINVFCWLGNIKKILNQMANRDYGPAPLVSENIGKEDLIVENQKDLGKIILANSFDIFKCPGSRLNMDDDVDPEDNDIDNTTDEDKKKLEFDNNIFSFVFLGKDPFSEDYSDVYCKKDREGLTVEQSKDDNINDNKSYFGYFKTKIQLLFDLDRIKNFLSQQKDCLSDKAESAGEEIKKLLDEAFILLKRYSEEGLEKNAIPIKNNENKNCCEECCKNICG